MATSWTAATFKADRKGAQFASADNDDITDAIAEAVRWLNEAAFGSTGRFDDAVFYLSAHYLTIQAQIDAASSLASSGAATAAGPIKAESAHASVQYAVPNFVSFDDAELGTTPWGRRFLSLRSMIEPERYI